MSESGPGQTGDSGPTRSSVTPFRHSVRQRCLVPPFECTLQVVEYPEAWAAQSRGRLTIRVSL